MIWNKVKLLLMLYEKNNESKDKTVAASRHLSITVIQAKNAEIVVTSGNVTCTKICNPTRSSEASCATNEEPR
jgi:hypothetical protein